MRNVFDDPRICILDMSPNMSRAFRHFPTFSYALIIAFILTTFGVVLELMR